MLKLNTNVGGSVAAVKGWIATLSTICRESASSGLHYVDFDDDA
jgi:hypothetical protein